MPFINKITLPTGTTYNFEGTIYSVIGTQSTTTASWTGTTTLTGLKDGVTIAYYLPTTSANNVTLNLTLNDGTTTGAKEVWFNGTRLGTQFPAKSLVILIYNETDDKWYSNTYIDEGKTYTFSSGSGSAASFTVTESGGSAQTIKVADVSTTVTQNENKLITSGAVWAAIDALPEPMVFKGTVGDAAQSPTVTWSNLPAAAAANQGFTYKVVTAHATAPICIIGDVITSNGSEWVVIPSGDDPGTTDTWRNILINGTEEIGSAINTGGLDFVNGTNTTVSLSANNELSINVPETKTYLSANAPKSSALTALPSTNTTDTFVKSYPGATSKLSTTTIYGVGSTTTTASKATAGTAVSVAKAGSSTSVGSGALGAETSTRGDNTPMWGATVANETLSFTFKPLGTKNVVPAVSNGTITPYTFADVTVPIKNTNTTTVATGSVAADAAGASVMTGLGTAATAAAITALGTPSSSQFVTGVSVSSGATGDVEVVTDIGPTS